MKMDCVQHPSDDITQTGRLIKDLESLYLLDENSDITLIVDGEKLHAHKLILVTRSQYFKALIHGGLKESSQREIELKETDLNAFKILLKYIYVGYLSLANRCEEEIISILGVVHQYGFVELEEAISNYLTEIIDVSNVCMILETARFYQQKSLIEICYKFIDANATDIIKHESFLKMSPLSLENLFVRDSLCASEIDIFMALRDWIEGNSEIDVIKSLIGKIRFNLISTDHLLDLVRPTNLVPQDVILDAIAANRPTAKLEGEPVPRGFLLDQNVACPKYGAKVIHGQRPNYLLDGNSISNVKTTWHSINKNQECIIIQLGKPYLLNYFKMRLADEEPSRKLSYYIEVSINMKEWIKIVDYSKYPCRSWQNLYFEPQRILYIKLVGTRDSAERGFEVIHFESYYTNDVVKLHNGFIVPTHNVGDVKNGALIRDGNGKIRDEVLREIAADYPHLNNYPVYRPEHQTITVQLNQPYIIESVRVLMQDLNRSTCSYYVELSENGVEWEQVVRKSHLYRSWHKFSFERSQPTVFIRVVNCNYQGKGLHCGGFECPSQC